MILLRFLISVFAILLAAYLVPGIMVDGLYTALIVAAILGIINILIRPVLILLTLPINILSLGLFTLVINGLLFWFVASFVEGFEVKNFGSAFLGALLVWLVGSLLNKAAKTN